MLVYPLERRKWGVAALILTLGLAGGWRSAVAETLAAGQNGRHVILLWMTGGPLQIDTFDLKPGHENGG